MAEVIPNVQDEPTESEHQLEENCKEIEGNLTEDDLSKVKVEASVKEGQEQLSDPVEGLVKDGRGNQLANGTKEWIGEITSDQTEESINKEPNETPAEESDDDTRIKPEETPTAAEPEGTPTEQPEGTPIEQPEGTPIEQPEGTPTEQPEGTPTEQPEGTPTEQSKGVPVEHSEGMSSTEQPDNIPSNQPETENIGDVSDEVIEEPVLTREDMMAELKEQLSTLDMLRAMNAHLQNKIADYLAKKKARSLL